MALTYVHTATGANTSFASSVTSSPLTTTSGNCLLVAVAADVVAQNGVTVTDNKGNTWHRLISVALPATFDLEIWAAYNITGGANHTVTATDNGGGVDSTILVEEWSGVASASALDQSASATDTGTTGVMKTAATSNTLHATELLWVAAVQGSGTTATFTAGTGFSNLHTVTTSFDRLGAASKAVSVTGAYTGEIDSTITNQSWIACLVTLQDDGSSITLTNGWSPSSGVNSSWTGTSQNQTSFGIFSGILYDELGRSYDAAEQSGDKKLYDGLSSLELENLGKATTSWT